MKYNAILYWLAIFPIALSIHAYGQTEFMRKMDTLGNLDNLYYLEGDSIYRSRQPSEKDFLSLKDKYRIKSVLKLNGQGPDSFKKDLFGSERIDMDYKHVQEDSVIKALKYLRSAHKPILVHCTAGVDRTGLTIALYRILFDGWCRKKAIAEMHSVSNWTEGYTHTDTGSAFIKYINNFDSASLLLRVLIDKITLDTIFQKNVQISGIASYNNHFYLVQEKRRIINVLDSSFKAVDFIDLSKTEIGNKKVELEGLAVYKDQLFITSEEAGEARIYCYDLKKTKLVDITPLNISNDYGDYGIEGIAVNDSLDICYTLKERNEDYKSVIKEFKIVNNKNTGAIQLNFIDSIIIDQGRAPEKLSKDNWRYSDIYFDKDKNRLICLRSLYAGEKSKYLIDTIAVGDNGFISGRISKNDPKMLIAEKQKMYDISPEILRLYRKDPDLNTNLEGLVLSKGNIFIISDNCRCDETGKDDHPKTLFLKLILK